MQQRTIDLNTATYVGIDAHPTEHTAVAVNRFEEEKGTLNFPHSWDGIQQFLSWLQAIEKVSQNVIIGVEGRGGKGSGFIASMLSAYEHVYEVNPQHTRQRRQFATKGGKSDVRDAKCRLVWYYEEETKVGARPKNISGNWSGNTSSA